MRTGGSPWWAAARLAAVLAALALFGAWWLEQKAPDFRVDQRLRLAHGPLKEPMRDVRAFVLGDEQRDAVLVPAGRALLMLPVTLPADDAVLRFRDGDLLGLSQTVVSLLRADGSREELERHDNRDALWHAWSVPLPASAGETVSVEFAVADGRAARGVGAAYVTDAVVESEGRGVDEGDAPVRTRALAADLLAGHGEENVLSPPTGDSARVGMDGPPCIALEERAPFFVTAEHVPPGGRLDIVLHLGRPHAGGPASEAAAVRLLADELPFALLPAVLPPGGDPLSADLLFRLDLHALQGRSVDFTLQREGGGNLFVGLRELSVSAPVSIPRRVHVPGQGPNVLLVSVDSLRADRLGCYGYAGGATPAIDALAARGGRYERVLAPSSWSLPDVATLLTGVSPVTHGLGLAPGRMLSPRLPTLAQSASWSGMTTAMFSNSALIAPPQGLDQGCETFVLRDVPAPILAEEALDWLEQAGQFQWFLELHVDDPSYPYAPAYRDAKAASHPPAPGLLDSLRRLDSRPGAAEAIAGEIGVLYDGEVAGVDRALGMLLAALERKGLLEDTVIAVVGTMGEEFFEHGGRLFGQSLHDEVVRVPLVLAGPGVRGADGRPAFVEAEPIELVDVTRLLGNLGSLSSLSTLQGRLPPPFGPRLPDPVSHSVLAPWPRLTEQALHASRTREWTAVTDERGGAVALFDRAADPGALKNLLSDGGDQASRFQRDSLASAFHDWWRGCLLPAASQPFPRDAELVAAPGAASSAASGAASPGGIAPQPGSAPQPGAGAQPGGAPQVDDTSRPGRQPAASPQESGAK